ncbi:uncharacterized protein J7T54_000876 [Emericellopsis cladophorae]|uniref:Ribosome biogenesis protein NOP53 n=1 Tax=Emericellopsis cladophorae TaxID=2686198 RepID=A0A9P9Y3X9_9HYPO|nr:uncharacterized protein J7T54_000876 [Emericellopsis cladophorae]KAI6782733.1 hypothetical protein J7T54_000876 [Emericellopsis cladophorae]
MPVIQGPTSGDAPQTFNQPSRKGKKAWRKNVDVTEVQQGLQDLNEEIIQGGVIREKDSKDLFTLDTTRDTTISKRLPKHLKKGLKADEIIAARSAVPAVSLRKRPSKTTDGILPVKRQRTDWVSQKELSRLKRVADGQHDNTVEVRDATYDLWDAEPKKSEVQIDEFFPEPVHAKTPKSMKQAPLSLLANGKTEAAVQRPTGGYSYNPAFSDYEKRLAAESAKAIEAEEKRLADLEAARVRAEAAARSAAEAEAAEARANMSEWEEDSEWEGFQSGAEDGRPTKLPQRKTPQQRNRMKRRKEEERLQKHKAAMKARRVQEQKIAELAQEVSEKEQLRALMRQQRALAAGSDSEGEIGEQKLRRKQLGKYKLPEKDLELVLPDELQDSLRLLKPEGNMMRDRYRSMLVRGKVEARRHLPFKKQAKRKVTEKWTHKDFVI